MAETATLTELDAAIDRRIVAMLNAVVKESRARSMGEPKIDRYQLEIVAKAMTPRVKKAEVVTLNPCRGCNRKPERLTNGFLWCGNTGCACNVGHSTDDEWNAANPPTTAGPDSIPPQTAAERRFTAGAEFEHKNGHRWRLVVGTHDYGTCVNVVNVTTWNDLLFVTSRSVAFNDNGYTMKEIFGVDHDFVPVG